MVAGGIISLYCSTASLNAQRTCLGPGMPQGLMPKHKELSHLESGSLSNPASTPPVLLVLLCSSSDSSLSLVGLPQLSPIAGLFLDGGLVSLVSSPESQCLLSLMDRIALSGLFQSNIVWNNVVHL